MSVFKYKITNIDKWRQATSSGRFQVALRQHMRRATELNGKVCEAAQRKTIQNGHDLIPNAALTVFIKKSKKPVVHNADLFQSITSQLVDDYTVITGVMRSNGEYNLALIIHEGATIQVTPKMRFMFLMLWKVATKQEHPFVLTGRAEELWKIRPSPNWRPLSESTTAIIIPARSWIGVTFEKTSFRNAIIRNWRQAIQAAIKEVSS